MQIVRTNDELASARPGLKGTLALVPTMGALHSGHMALVEEGKRLADKVAASIFVNPSQFNDKDDLARYPRHESEDARKLEEAGCDLLWLPAVDDVYPPGFSTSVHVSGVSDRWEGEARPGHFNGVATVVAKLLLSVAADVALFGEKDFQQLAVIRRMISDLNIRTDIVGIPTVREADGLALSSRNAYLSPDERRRAVAIPQALKKARDLILGGAAVRSALRDAKQALIDAGFLRIDYLALVDSATLEPLEEPTGEMRLIVAAVIGSTRLIDNIHV